MNIGTKIKELRKQRGITQEQLAKSRAILEEGLKKYPDNDVILNNLLYVINYSESPDETIAIASKLSENTTESDVNYDALRFLAYAYKAKGDVKNAKAALEQIPKLYFTKLTEIAYLLDGVEKFEAAEKQKWLSFENLLQMMPKLAECCEADGDIKKRWRNPKRHCSCCRF